MLPAPEGAPHESATIDCQRSERGVVLVFGGAIRGRYTYSTASDAQEAAADWFEMNLRGGRLVVVRSRGALVGVAEKPHMAIALLAESLRRMRS